MSASAVGGTRQIELSVQGMTCASCAARVEKKLGKIEGVSAAVNYATGTARITAPPGVSDRELADAVERAGYRAEIPEPPGPDAEQDADERHAAWLRRRLFLALVFYIPLSDVSLMLSLVPAYRFPGWQWVLAGCAAPVVLWAAWPFHKAALAGARRGAVTMDTLVSLGVVASSGWSAYAMFALDRGGRGQSVWQLLVHASGGGIYLETAATVTTFLLAGRLYEARARRAAGQAMRDLAAAAGAREACLLGPDGTERHVPASALRPGDTFVVRPGESIAADGQVLFGQSAVDRAMMTGESVPADVGEGDQVTGGTVVVTGRLVVRAVRTGSDTQLARLIRLVEEAQGQKAAIQRLADRVCGVFVPLVLVFSALTLAGWLLAGGTVGQAFSAALAVLIIACPCALGLATPAALVAACGRGAQLGIFIKGYQVLEASRAVDTVVLDKTGTVTTGRMSLAGVRPADGVSRTELLRYAGAVEQASEHAVAAAIAAAAAETGPLPQASGFTALPGLGACGTVDGRAVTVGRQDLFTARGTDVPADLTAQCRAWEQAGRTAVLAGWDGAVRGALAVTDTVKPHAAAAVAALRGLGLHPVLLTGDSEATARAVAAATGIGEVIAGTLPDGKAAVIAELQGQGRRVAMVGDGVNDAPALATAGLGLALGTGTDVAISAADMILLRDDLRIVADAIRLARVTFTTIRRNLAWAFGYNLAALPLAALGYLNPVIASAAMTLSSVFVVWNSLRLRRFRASTPPPARAARRSAAAPPDAAGQHHPAPLGASPPAA
jgi:P-type Cu+ transporter